MKFEEVLPALREGKKAKRKDRMWENNYGWIFFKDGKVVSDNIYEDKYRLTEEDLNTDNWEIVKEPKKIKLRDLTKQQYMRFVDSRCENGTMGIGCVDCPFRFVGCAYGRSEKCWIDNKDLYSDKFLDQEIEIEEE